MLKIIQHSVLAGCLILITTACSQHVDFSDSSLGQKSLGTPSAPVDPICERTGPPDFWIGNGTTTVECPDACPDGSHLQCTAVLEEEVTCVNGQVSPVGPTQPGDIIGPIGTCPVVNPPGKACGSNADGSNWWQDSGSTTTQTCDVCADGTPHICTVNVQNQYVCHDDVTSTTGLTQNGSVIGYVNECLPPPPASCGDQASGATWWAVSGQQTAVCQTCWDGSQIQCTYNTEVQESCNNGVTSATGQTRQGSLIGPNGQCAPQPKDCGDVKNGQTTWQANGQTDPYQCGTCSDGSAHMCIAELDQQLVCNDGALSPTGLTKNGQVLGYTNTCPNLTNKDETYTVPNTPAKADVMFIVDTTPSMYTTIVSLATKFNSLISSWSDLDWQIGITNANPVASVFDPHAMGGNLEVLNAYPEPYSNLTVLNKNVAYADWIFKQNMNFNGLSWPDGTFCDQQPYCQTSSPEPLKEIMYAIDKRNSSANSKFFRSGSTFVPIILSDSDEKETGPQNPYATTPQTVVNYFKTKMTSMQAMKAFSIIVKPGDTSCFAQHSSVFQSGGGGVYGKYLDQFATLTGGSSISICQSDYSKSLANLSQVIRQQVTSVKLAAVPWKDSLTITFSPSYSGHWVLQGQTVVFDKPLPPGTKLTIHYMVSQ